MFSDKVCYWASRPLVGTYTSAMLKMDIQKHEQVHPGAKIIAANHPSTSDPFFVAAMLQHQVFILIKDLLFDVPVLGEYLRRSGHIPVRAGGGQEAIQAALEHLRAGHTVMIFPEGAVSPLQGGFHQARTGVARLALLSGAPVIPVGIHLARERIHAIRSVVKGKEEYGHWYISGPYNITVGHPLHYSGSVEDWAHVRSVSDAIMHHIIELARESENRLTPATGTLAGALGAV